MTAVSDRTDAPAVDSPESRIERFDQVRSLTESLAAPLSAEDQTVQSMPDASPTKWHRAHTTWFFETFVLEPHLPGYAEFDPGFRYLFNSYYEAVGARHPRPQRGLISRPSTAEVAAYRRYVDDHMHRLMERPMPQQAAGLVELGLHHEQQHQELLLMDIKHALAMNPLDPVYSPRPGTTPGDDTGSPPGWIAHPGGEAILGAAGGTFSFDNERPAHVEHLVPFEVADRLVTCGQWLEFMGDGGYDRPDLWLSDGWALVQHEGWRAPMYWRDDGGEWTIFTLGGRRTCDLAEPVCHVSYYEADAFARWAGARLPTEFEWEAVAQRHPAEGRFLDPEIAHPCPQPGPALFGDAWAWTASAYLAYPGFRPAAGAVGEYNGKFMVNQHVLRGGACATPEGHVRATYRNFFPPASRWPFTGLRLAHDL